MWIKKSILHALIAGLGFLPAAQVTAQTLTSLHAFSNSGPGGIGPVGGLILSGQTLYGTTDGGLNASSGGTIFSVSTDGSGFTNLFNFTNSDGTIPVAALILLGNTLYGTASAGGTNGNGTIFAINTDGTGFTNLYSFTALGNGTNSDGAQPKADLILSGNTLFGTASKGGSSGSGTVFAINTDGTDFTNLHNFTATAGKNGTGLTNSDGATPLAGLVLSGNALYGTTSAGGTNADGTIFAVNTDGTGFTNIYNLAAQVSFNPNSLTNSDGAFPHAGLVLSGNVLYGTAYQGGTNADGTIFSINTDGTDFTNLHNFAGVSSGGPPPSNSDGFGPVAGLILSGHTLYGTTHYGGKWGSGTIFSLNINGSDFTTLYAFTLFGFGSNTDGALPSARLILSGNALYGTAVEGGIQPGIPPRGGGGTVFSLSLPLPQLAITLSGTNAVLTWPTDMAGVDYSGFVLQSTTNLVLPDWITITGQNAVTNPVCGTQMFYRLIQ